MSRSPEADLVLMVRMNRRGWLVRHRSVLGIYAFGRTVPDEYQYALTAIAHPTASYTVSYQATGWECVLAQHGIQVFRNWNLAAEPLAESSEFLWHQLERRTTVWRACAAFLILLAAMLVNYGTQLGYVGLLLVLPPLAAFVAWFLSLLGVLGPYHEPH